MRPTADTPSWPALPAHAGAENSVAEDPVARPPLPNEAARLVLDGALRWTEANLEWFAPQRWEEYLPPRPFKPGPLLELLGLLRVLERSHLVPVDAPLRLRALDLAEEAAHSDGFVRGMSRGDEFFPYHLNLIGLLKSLGRPQRELHARCEALLAAGAGGHALPYKPVLNRIELRYFIDRGGFTPPAALPGVGALYEQSIAALGPDVLQLTEGETYAFTHVLFYLTDFGHSRRHLRGPKEEARLRKTVRVLLGVHLARGSLDLLAELLLCDSALGEAAKKDSVPCPGPGPASGPDPDPRSPNSGPGSDSKFLVNASWNALVAAARPDGSIPSPVHRPDILAGLTGDKAAAYVFGTCYHTTLAAALAAGVALSPDPVGFRAGGAGARCACPAIPLPRAEPGQIREWARVAGGAAETVTTGCELAAWRGYVGSLLVLVVQARDAEALADVLRAAERLGRGGDLLVRSADALLRAWNR